MLDLVGNIDCLFSHAKAQLGGFCAALNICLRHFSIVNGHNN